MYTYEMVGIADENGRTYTSKYGTYNKEDGFKTDKIPTTKLINELFHENCWSLYVEPKKMTKAEIEEALGYPVDIDDSSDDSVKVTTGKDAIDLLERMFGWR